LKLSPHFTLDELSVTSTGLPNIVPAHVIPRLKLVATHILEPVRAKFGPFSPNSGYRSPAVNRAVGGSKSSQHAKGEAVDFEVPGVSNRDLFMWCRANLEFDQLILEFHDPAKGPASGWVHASFRDVLRNRNQAFSLG
jgi:hypothetical protein